MSNSIHYNTILDNITVWRDIRHILTDYKNPDYHKNVKEVEDRIVANKNVYLAYVSAMEVHDYDIRNFQQVILDHGSPHYFYLFARNVPAADLHILEKEVLKSKQLSCITDYVCHVPVVHFNKFQSFIAESKSPSHCYKFIKHVKSADISLFKEIIMKSGKSRYIFELAKHLTCEKERLECQEKILKNKSNTYVRLFAQHIEGADVKRLEKRIIKTANRKEIEKFGEKLNSETCKKLTVLF